MATDARGTFQRLKPADATIRSLEKTRYMEARFASIEVDQDDYAPGANSQRSVFLPMWSNARRNPTRRRQQPGRGTRFPRPMNGPRVPARDLSACGRSLHTENRTACSCNSCRSNDNSEPPSAAGGTDTISSSSSPQHTCDSLLIQRKRSCFEPCWH